MEMNESTAEGAARETLEEANALVSKRWRLEEDEEAYEGERGGGRGKAKTALHRRRRRLATLPPTSSSYLSCRPPSSSPCLLPLCPSAQVHVVAPYMNWDIPAISQVYILFRASLAPPFTFSPGSESLETKLFSPEEIPFDQLAFSSVSTSLT